LWYNTAIITRANYEGMSNNKERGGGVKLATKFTKIREVINKQGDVVKQSVEKPDEPRKMRPLTITRTSERLR